MDELEQLLTTLTRFGVEYYKSADIELRLATARPPEQAEGDFEVDFSGIQFPDESDGDVTPYEEL